MSVTNLLQPLRLLYYQHFHSLGLLERDTLHDCHRVVERLLLSLFPEPRRCCRWRPAPVSSVVDHSSGSAVLKLTYSGLNCPVKELFQLTGKVF